MQKKGRKNDIVELKNNKRFEILYKRHKNISSFKPTLKSIIILKIEV